MDKILSWRECALMMSVMILTILIILMTVKTVFAWLYIYAGLAAEAFIFNAIFKKLRRS